MKLLERTIPESILQGLKDQFVDKDCVWFLVNLKYRVVAYNKTAARNSVSFHKKEIAPGASILDYARDTKSNVDSEFIRCFGKAATGQQVKSRQTISYDSATIISAATYTPVMDGGEVIAISIFVEVKNVAENSPQAIAPPVL